MIVPTSAPGRGNRLHAVSNLPPRLTYFTGHDTLLSELQTRFEQASIEVLCGMGGIGKTQLAIEYAYRYREQYGLVWWLDASSDTTIIQGFKDLLGTLDLGEPLACEPESIVAQALSTLSRAGQWLLVFDGAEDVKQVLDHRPVHPTGRILVTSRHRDWARIGTPIVVPPLAQDQAVAFLERRTGCKIDQTGRHLACMVGYLPLALDQVARYMAPIRIGYAEYASRLSSTPGLLGLPEPRPNEYAHTVQTVWNETLGTLEQEAIASRYLLEFAVFLAARPIPRELLAWVWWPGKESLEPAEAIRVTERALQLLHRWCLIDLDESYWTVPLVVLGRIRNGLSSEARHAHAESAIRAVCDSVNRYLLVNKAMSGDEMGESVFMHAVHVLYVLGLKQQPLAWDISLRASRFFAEQKMDPAARTFYDLALKHAPESPTERDGDAIRAYARVLLVNGQPQNAYEPYVRASRILDATSGRQADITLDTLHELGVLCQQIGKTREAISYLRWALKGRLTRYGESHILVYESANALWPIEFRCGNHSKALYAIDRVKRYHESQEKSVDKVLHQVYIDHARVLLAGQYELRALAFFRKGKAFWHQPEPWQSTLYVVALQQFVHLLLKIERAYGEADALLKELEPSLRRCDHPTPEAWTAFDTLVRDVEYQRSRRWSRTIMHAGRRVLGLDNSSFGHTPHAAGG